jgi:adhesin transport system membrane fusion protein
MNSPSSRNIKGSENCRLPAINLTGSNRVPHLFSRALIIAFVVLILFVALVPWRQFVRGSGSVIAYDPLERRINVEALVSGRVSKLYVNEGQKIKQGDLIAEIQDNDPNFLENLRAQRTAAMNRIDLVKTRVEALESQIAQQTMAKEQALDAARQKVSADKIAAETAMLDYTRVDNLFQKGLSSRREFEAAILRRDSTAANLLSSEATLKRTESEFNALISSTTASRQSARSDIAKAQEELTGLEIRVSQNMRQVITSPREGIVLQVPVTEGSYLKPGDPLCVVIPDTATRYAEIWVDGNDVALIRARKEEKGVVTPGSPVRLVFEGWPAIQAIGWPQLAVGSFGGEVMYVDATDDGQGKFRVLVAPAEDVVDRGDGNGPVTVPWPDGDRWLRQGVQTNAWVLLDEVPLWFELWRQMNGFPAIGTGMKEETEKLKKK